MVVTRIRLDSRMGPLWLSRGSVMVIKGIRFGCRKDRTDPLVVEFPSSWLTSAFKRVPFTRDGEVHEAGNRIPPFHWVRGCKAISVNGPIIPFSLFLPRYFFLVRCLRKRKDQSHVSILPLARVLARRSMSKSQLGQSIPQTLKPPRSVASEGELSLQLPQRSGKPLMIRLFQVKSSPTKGLSKESSTNHLGAHLRRFMSAT